MAVQFITRKGSFDAGHRVMNERMKCFNLHGHTYLYELCFACTYTQEIGYTIDFKEIKRVACQFIEDYFDHGMILNPEDTALVEACEAIGSKMWLMHLSGPRWVDDDQIKTYCNPTVENIAKEIFHCIFRLMKEVKGLRLFSLRLYETPNCFCDTTSSSLTADEVDALDHNLTWLIDDYRKKAGSVEYDDRKI